MSKSDIINIDAFANMTKRDLQESAVQLAQTEVEGGFIEPLRMTVKINKAIEFLTTYKKEIESVTFDDHHHYGMKTVNIENAQVTLKHGYPILDYSSDMVYQDLKQKLDARKALLDHKFKHPELDVYDEDGIAIPKVPVKRDTKDSLHIKY